MRAHSTRHTQPTLPRPPHWDDNAACRSSDKPETWFAEGDSEKAVADRQEAKRVCQRCRVLAACLQAALARREPIGVWGGLDEDERAQLALPKETAGGPQTQHAQQA